MSRNPLESPLPAEKYEQSTTETVELTEIDGMEQGAILRYTDIGGSGKPAQEREIRTCYGDLYVIVNALRDYSVLLESVVLEWELTGYHAATYEIHSARCRKIAEKYAAAIGYDYDKAMERCKNRRENGWKSDDTGMDGLEAMVRKRQATSNEKKKKGRGRE